MLNICEELKVLALVLLFHLPRFQDEDDIFGFDKPPSRGRSPASSIKKPEGMEWLDHLSPRTTPTKETKEEPAVKPPPTKDTSSKETKEPSAMKSTPVTPPAKTMNKPKVDPFEYLGLKDDDDDDAFEWMKPKQTETRPRTGELRDQTETRPRTGELRDQPDPEPLSQPKRSEPPKIEHKAPESVKTDQSPDDYLGLGGEVDLDSILK